MNLIFIKLDSCWCHIGERQLSSLADADPRRPVLFNRLQKEREAAQQWKRVQELWPRMLAGEEEPLREWLIEAEKLVEAFRETRALFLTSRVRHVGSLRSIKVADGLSQHRGFRGMFPRSSRKQPSEANEDNMASRLQLELGMFIFKRTSPL